MRSIWPEPDDRSGNRSGTTVRQTETDRPVAAERRCVIAIGEGQPAGEFLLDRMVSCAGVSPKSKRMAAIYVRQSHPAGGDVGSVEHGCLKRMIFKARRIEIGFM
ncbi:hypothetical protein BS630_33835 [Rhizobium laguerreae]|nr:hypothetical protein BS630_33835 [Rhizobium laguerreae]